MKKILAILLALACLFSVCACAEDETPNDNNNNQNDDGTQTNAEILALFEDLLSKSAPTKSYVVTTEDFGRNHLESTVTITAGTVDGKDATVMVIEKQTLNDVENRELNLVETTVTNQWYLEDKGVSYDKGRRWDSTGTNFAPKAGSLKLELDEENFSSIEYDEATGTLKLVTPYQTAAKVLSAYIPSGIEHEFDTTITVVAAGGRITNIKIEYTIESEDIGDITTSVEVPEITVVINANYYYDLQDITLG